MICVGLILGDVAQIGSPVDEEIASLTRAVAREVAAHLQRDVPTISVDFYLPGNLCVHRWDGLRVMRYSTKHKIVSIGVVVPQSLFSSDRATITEFAVRSLRNAVRLAVPVFRRNGVEFPASDAETLIDRVEGGAAD